MDEFGGGATLELGSSDPFGEIHIIYILLK